MPWLMSPPEMTALRITKDAEGNTQLLQLLKKWEMNMFMGQFETPKLKPNVEEMKSFHIGRESFLITASKAVIPLRDAANVVESFKFHEVEMTGVTINARMSYLVPRKIGYGERSSIAVQDVKSIDIIRYSSSIHLAILDGSGKSRLRVFRFNPMETTNVFDMVDEVEFDHDVFQTLHSFNHQGRRYLALSGSKADINKAVVTEVSDI